MLAQKQPGLDLFFDPAFFGKSIHHFPIQTL
jgi:hypothetical protein